MARFFFPLARSAYKLQDLDKGYFYLLVSPLAPSRLESSYKSLVSLSVVQNPRRKVLHTCFDILIKYRYFRMLINSPDKLSQNTAAENAESSLAFCRRNYLTFYK